jgi:hypothetical protein
LSRVAPVEAAEPGPAVRAEPGRLPGRVFFALSLAVALTIGMFGLERFPIFFLGDEAVESVRAASTIRDGFRDEFGQLLPAVFKNEQTFNLGITPYVHMLPTALFGHSIAATRGTELVFSVAGLAAVALLLRDFFSLRFWWAGVLVVATIPGWFLHTRLAFGIPIAIGFFAWFLYFYARYRSGRARAVFPSIAFGALTFYAYTGFQPVLIVLAVLLLVLDAPWHWRNRNVLPAAVALVLLLAFPGFRFLRSHPEDLQLRLQSYGSEWARPGPGSRKLLAFARGYADALSPSYWLDPESPRDLVRHRMKGYGQILPATVPLAALGLVLCFARIREPAPRMLLAVLVAAPCGAALVGPGITRELALVLAYGMVATLGLDFLLRRLPSRAPAPAVAAAVFLLFSAGATAMLADSLRTGARWYSDYGLYGMQWGAREVFGEIRRGLVRGAAPQYYVSPDWANAVEQLVLFFCPGDARVEARHLEYYRDHANEVDPRAIHVLTPEEFQTLASRRFRVIAVQQVIPYPDGLPGFYFVRLKNL